MPVRLLSRSGVEGDGVSPRDGVLSSSETTDDQSQSCGERTPGVLRHNNSMGAFPSYEAAATAGWVSTMTKDDARDKAVSSHETMGLVSALLAGFELQALVEVDLCDDVCTGAESAFIVCSSYCVGLSMIVVLETSFEYMFVMRELHHGHASAWNLIRHFRYCRRIAEGAFALVILMFLISTGLMVHVRFARTLVVGTIFSHVLLGINFCVVFFIVYAMQNAKIQHGEGSKMKREEARAAALRRQEEEIEMRARAMREPYGAPAPGGLPHKLKVRTHHAGPAPAPARSRAAHRSSSLLLLHHCQTAARVATTTASLPPPHCTTPAHSCAGSLCRVGACSSLVAPARERPPSCHALDGDCANAHPPAAHSMAIAQAAGMNVRSLKRISTIFTPGESGRPCFGEGSSDGIGLGGGATAACARSAGAGPSSHVAFAKEARLSLLRSAKSGKLCRRHEDADAIGPAVANVAALKRAATAGSLNSVDLTRETTDECDSARSARSAIALSSSKSTAPVQSPIVGARSDACGESGCETPTWAESRGETSKSGASAQSSFPRGSVASLDIGGVGVGPGSPPSAGAARPGGSSGVGSGGPLQPAGGTPYGPCLTVDETGQPQSPRAGRSDSLMMGV